MLGEQDRAIEHLRQAVANNPDFPTPIAWLTALLALTGNAVEAHETLRRYLALRTAKTRTVAQWKASAWGNNPGYLAFCEHLTKGCVSQVWKNESHCRNGELSKTLNEVEVQNITVRCYRNMASLTFG